MKELSASKQIIQSFLKSIGQSLTSTTELINQRHPDNQTSVQNLNNKLTRDSIRLTEVMEIADVHGYKVCFRPISEPDYQPEQKKRPITWSEEKETPIQDITTRLDEGTASIESTNADYLIVGRKCEQAKQKFIEMLNSDKITKSDNEEFKELLISRFVENLYDVMILSI